MSKRSREEDVTMDESLGIRAAKKKVLEMNEAERAKKAVAANKREVNKKLRSDVDDLSNLFGNMTATTPPEANMEIEGSGRRRRKTKRRSMRKARKTRGRR
jgi:hypothetical protein